MLLASAGLHAVLLLALPGGVEPVRFDVERAATSVELVLAPPAPAASLAVQAPVQLLAPPAPRISTPAPEPPAAQPALRPARPPAPQRAPAPETSSPHRGAALSADLLPDYLRNPAPVYPDASRRKGHQGTVVLEAEVLASGRCGSIRILDSSGHEELDQTAIAAVRTWRFRPARRWQTPVAFWVEIPIRFQLIE